MSAKTAGVNTLTARLPDLAGDCLLARTCARHGAHPRRQPQQGYGNEARQAGRRKSEAGIALPGCNAEKHRRRDGGARIARERMNGKGAAHAALVDAAREHRVVGRVVDAVGEARQAHRDQQPSVGRQHPEREEARTAQQQPEGQHPARTEAVDGEAQRRLHQRRDDIEHAEREAQFDEAHPHLVRQQRQQRRQRHDVQVADQVGSGNLAQKGDPGELHVVLGIAARGQR